MQHTTSRWSKIMQSVLLAVKGRVDTMISEDAQGRCPGKCGSPYSETRKRCPDSLSCTECCGCAGVKVFGRKPPPNDPSVWSVQYMGSAPSTSPFYKIPGTNEEAAFVFYNATERDFFVGHVEAADKRLNAPGFDIVLQRITNDVYIRSIAQGDYSYTEGGVKASVTLYGVALRVIDVIIRTAESQAPKMPEIQNHDHSKDWPIYTLRRK